MIPVEPRAAVDVITLADRIKVWFLNRLDDDSVRAWVPGYCAVWLTWSLLAVAWLPPVSTIEPVMGHVAYLLWLWIAIPANLAPIAGLRMRHGGAAVADMSTRLLFRDWMGLIFQATGHAVCHVLMLLFQISAWIAVWTYHGPSPYAGMTAFCATMLLPWTFGTALLCAQCIRKLQRGGELEKSATQ